LPQEYTAKTYRSTQIRKLFGPDLIVPQETSQQCSGAVNQDFHLIVHPLHLIQVLLCLLQQLSFANWKPIIGRGHGNSQVVSVVTKRSKMCRSSMGQKKMALERGNSSAGLSKENAGGPTP
jgi:hypothetical protein